MNKWLHFRQHFQPQFLESLPQGAAPPAQGVISSAASAAWANMSDQERAVYADMAAAEAERHQREFPNYKYAPTCTEAAKRRRRLAKEKRMQENEKLSKSDRVYVMDWNVECLPEYFYGLQPGDLNRTDNLGEIKAESDVSPEEGSWSEMSSTSTLGPSDWPDYDYSYTYPNPLLYSF